MEKNFKHVYQLKISLVGINPTIWRRIHVPDTYTFSNLHTAIQQAMGWYDCHLYEFSTLSGIPLSENDLIRNVIISSPHKKVRYEYDFGDSWLHDILWEKTLPANDKVQYPLCINGERACPPEDCGGVPGYSHLLQILKNPKNKEYGSMLEWLGEDFDPEEFNLKEISFADNE